MKYRIINKLLASVFLLMSLNANAGLITITPGDCVIGVNCWTVVGDNSNISADELFGYTGMTGLASLYKGDVNGDPDSGVFADSYDTVFSNSVSDPADGLITWNDVPNPAIDCSTLINCILVIKDGNQSPSAYLFNLTAFNWDGMMDINMTGFWPNQGAISHIEIFSTSPNGGGGGGGQEIPEPGMLFLLLIAFAGLYISQIKR